jgi:hypothetical protein
MQWHIIAVIKATPIIEQKIMAAIAPPVSPEGSVNTVHAPSCSLQR